MTPTPQSVPASSCLDWDELDAALARFSAATGLYVCVYDSGGSARSRPHVGSGVAGVLMDKGVLAEGGAAQRVERELAAQVCATGMAAELAVGGDLEIRALPLQVNGQLVGAVAYGWAFSRFPTSLGCQGIARKFGMDGVALWATARLTAPTSTQRMSSLTALLESIIASAARHALAVGQLVALGQLRETFLAFVSHELRAPLGVLAMRVDYLLRTPLDDPRGIRDSLVNMKQHVQAESRLIEDLIDVARTRTGQFTMQRRAVGLDAVLAGALGSVTPYALAKQVAVHAPNPEAVGSITVFADAHRLQQVLWNLLSNAIKFTPEGGLVQLLVLREPGACLLKVVDSGAGIEAALLPRVFEAFARQEENNAQGLGLGLSIAQHIVAAHDGQIWVESQGAGLGTTFYVRLPTLDGGDGLGLRQLQ